MPAVRYTTSWGTIPSVTRRASKTTPQSINPHNRHDPLPAVQPQSGFYDVAGRASPTLCVCDLTETSRLTSRFSFIANSDSRLKKWGSALDRTLLSDEQYERIAPILPGKPGDPGRTAADNRLFLEAVSWIVRTGAPWRDLRGIFGGWNTVFRRFRRWAKGGIFDKIFKSLSGDPDFEYAIVDGTIVRVHKHGTGAKGGLAIRPSTGRAEA